MLLLAGKYLVSLLCVIVDNTEHFKQIQQCMEKRKAVIVTFMYQMLISLFTRKV